MKFSIALHGSFKDSAGYTWRVPSGIDTSILERIVLKLERQYNDGRKLPLDSLFGGYYIDASHDRFYAFRFLDGGRDNLGRAGVVITNWAIGSYSEVVGKDISALFARMTFMELPVDGCVDIFLLPSPSNLSASPFFLSLEDSQVFNGKEARCVFQLPRNKSRVDIFVEFSIEDEKQWSKVQLSKREVKNTPPRIAIPKEVSRPQPRDKRSIDFSYLINWRWASIIVLCAIGLFFMRFEKRPSTALPSKTENSGVPSTVKSKPPQKTLPVGSSTLAVIAQKFVFQERGASWMLDETLITSKKYLYPWGSVEINNHQFIWQFNEGISFKPVSGKRECKVLSGREEIGRIESSKDSQKFIFSSEQNQQSNNFTEERLVLINKFKEVSAQLTIKRTSIIWESFPAGKTIENPKKRGWFSGVTVSL